MRENGRHPNVRDMGGRVGGMRRSGAKSSSAFTSLTLRCPQTPPMDEEDAMVEPQVVGLIDNADTAVQRQDGPIRDDDVGDGKATGVLGGQR